MDHFLSKCIFICAMRSRQMVPHFNFSNLNLRVSFVVQEFCKKKKLTHFGMPVYIGSGSHEYNGKKYRFLVMEKFGSDIWKLFLENNRKFPVTTVYQLGLQIVGFKMSFNLFLYCVKLFLCSWTFWNTYTKRAMFTQI